MAEMTIRLQIDPATGKKNIVVSLRSDEDALPHEHEQRHRALVDKLIQGGVLKASELGQVIVEREEETATSAGPVATPPVGERKAQAQGGS
jgi:FtsH ternary system domain X3-analog